MLVNEETKRKIFRMSRRNGKSNMVRQYLEAVLQEALDTRQSVEVVLLRKESV